MVRKPAADLFPGGEESDPETALVGVVRRKSDLGRAAEEGWYRIPGTVRFRRRPRYLALYPVRSCGRAGGKISWYAPVVKITRTRRIELLPGEPGHPRAGEWYWKLELGKPVKLPRPVRNRLRRRLTFAYTTIPRLRRAREIGELFGVPPLEEIARRGLAGAGIPAREQFTVRSGKEWRYRIDFAVFCRRGKIALECDHSRWHGQPARKKSDRLRDRRLEKAGWTVRHFSEDAILLEPLAMTGKVRRLVEALGGQESGEEPFSVAKKRAIKTIIPSRKMTK